MKHPDQQCRLELTTTKEAVVIYLLLGIVLAIISFGLWRICR